MKKYFPGLTAIVCVVVLSAFAKPYALQDFKLTLDPSSPNVVDDPSNWSTGGIFYSGSCGTQSAIVACKIKVKSSLTQYYHTVGADDILNDANYANSQNPKQSYFEISDQQTTGQGGMDWKITFIMPKKWDSGADQYVNDNSVIQDVDYTWTNGFEAP